jgi:type II secretory pathway pseudopilin PulG
MTLVEVIAALFVFSLVAMGIFPLIASSIRGANVSRSYTVGKNLGVKAMERIRGLPYSLNQAGTLDVLDMYIPNAAAPNYSAGVYTTTCTPTSSNPACPRDIPNGYSIDFKAAFVPFGGGAPIVVSTSEYPSSNVTKDLLPSQMLDISVVTKWTFPGTQEQFTLRTLVGDRKFGGLKLNGTGSVDYGVQVLASYNSGTELRDLTAMGGVAQSNISMRASSRAEQIVRAGILRVVDGTDPSAPNVDSFEGASALLAAPPDAAPGDVSGEDGDVDLPLIGDVARIDDTTAGIPNAPLPGDLRVSRLNDLPLAQGGFGYQVDDGGGERNLWVDIPIAERPGPLQLRSDRNVFSIKATEDPDATLTGYSSAATGAVGAADRGVRTAAHVEFVDLRLFPTSFATGGVVQVDDFVADVSCNSTANGATASATRSWSATLRWYEDALDDYHEEVIGSSSTSDVFAPLVTNPPLVGRGSPPDLTGASPNDTYLYPISHDHEVVVEDETITIHHDHPGYLAPGTEMLENLGAGSVSGDGRVTEASIENAITLETVPVPATPPYAAAPITVSIGALHCNATDNR